MVRISRRRLIAMIRTGCVAAALGASGAATRVASAEELLAASPETASGIVVHEGACPPVYASEGPVALVTPFQCRPETFAERLRSVRRRLSWKHNAKHNQFMYWDSPPQCAPTFGYHETVWRQGSALMGVDHCPQEFCPPEYLPGLASPVVPDSAAEGAEESPSPTPQSANPMAPDVDPNASPSNGAADPEYSPEPGGAAPPRAPASERGDAAPTPPEEARPAPDSPIAPEIDAAEPSAALEPLDVSSGDELTAPAAPFATESRPQVFEAPRAAAADLTIAGEDAPEAAEATTVAGAAANSTETREAVQPSDARSPDMPAQFVDPAIEELSAPPEGGLLEPEAAAGSVRLEDVEFELPLPVTEVGVPEDAPGAAASPEDVAAPSSAEMDITAPEAPKDLQSAGAEAAFELPQAAGAQAEIPAAETADEFEAPEAPRDSEPVPSPAVEANLEMPRLPESQVEAHSRDAACEPPAVVAVDLEDLEVEESIEAPEVLESPAAASEAALAESPAAPVELPKADVKHDADFAAEPDSGLAGALKVAEPESAPSEAAPVASTEGMAESVEAIDEDIVSAPSAGTAAEPTDSPVATTDIVHEAPHNARPVGQREARKARRSAAIRGCAPLRESDGAADEGCELLALNGAGESLTGRAPRPTHQLLLAPIQVCRPMPEALSDDRTIASGATGLNRAAETIREVAPSQRERVVGAPLDRRALATISRTFAEVEPAAFPIRPKSTAGDVAQAVDDQPAADMAVKQTATVQRSTAASDNRRDEPTDASLVDAARRTAAMPSTAEERRRAAWERWLVAPEVDVFPMPGLAQGAAASTPITQDPEGAKPTPAPNSGVVVVDGAGESPSEGTPIQLTGGVGGEEDLSSPSASLLAEPSSVDSFREASKNVVPSATDAATGEGFKSPEAVFPTDRGRPKTPRSAIEN